MSKYITDAMIAPSSYQTIVRLGATETNFTIPNLKAATWYHIRLSIEYLGVRVTSEALNVPTGRSVPAAPTTPRVTLVPVRNSFDLKSIIPARYEFLITWNAVIVNGSPVDRYQVQLQRLDACRQPINDDPPVTTMHRPSTTQNASSESNEANLRGKHLFSLMNESKAVAILTQPSNRKSNQWVSSPGRSETQIRNSLQSRRRPTALDQLQTNRSPQKKKSSSPSPSRNPDSQLLENSVSPIWRIIYDNLTRNVRLSSPKPTDAIWMIRVRAHNREGWSPFSPILELSWKTHPAHFTCRPISMSNSSQLENHLSVSVTINNNGSQFEVASPMATMGRNGYFGTPHNGGPMNMLSPMSAAVGADEERFNNITNTARTEESCGSQRSKTNISAGNNNGNGQGMTVTVTPLSMTMESRSHSNNNSNHQTPQNVSSRLSSKQGTAKGNDEFAMHSSRSASDANNNNSSNHTTLHLPHISTDYEHLVEKNASSTSLMLEHNHASSSASNHHSAANTPTVTAALQQHRIQQFQEHFLNNSNNNNANNSNNTYGNHYPGVSPSYRSQQQQQQQSSLTNQGKIVTLPNIHQH